MTTDGDAILEAVGLTKHFPTRKGVFRRGPPVRAVDGVTLRVRRGETFAVVGESGCGKSTLGRCLLRLIEPTSGDVLYDGRDLLSLAPAALRKLRREMQIIFQDPFASLNPRMTVGDIVGEPIRLHDPGLAKAERRERVAALLRRVGLRAGHAARYPHAFSGGQRQRVGIARALAAGPRLILGDEPVSALDVSIQAQIVNLLEDLKAEMGLTLVLIAHDLAVIRHMSDRVAVMYLGELVETAPTDRLFEAPLHPYTHALLAAVPVPSPRARGTRTPLAGDVPSPIDPPPGCRFHPRCPHARDVCREAAPKTEAAGDGRAVACHFWREIASAGAGAFAEPPVSEARARRAELFTIGRERQDARAAPSPSHPTRTADPCAS